MRSMIKNKILDNAISLGWIVEKKDNNTFILKKKINELKKYEKNTDKLIDILLDVRNF